MGPISVKHPIETRDPARTGALRLNEGAKLLGVSAGTLRRWTNDGKVHCLRTPGGQRRFRLQDFADAGLIDLPSPKGLVAHAEAGAGNGRRRDDSRAHLARENAVLARRLERTDRDLKMLVNSGLQVSASLDLDEVLRTVAARMVLAADASYCDVFGLEDGVFHCLVSFGPGDAASAYVGTRVTLEDTGMGRLVVDSREPVAIYDARDDERLSDAEREDFISWGLRSAILLPLLAGGRVVGTVEVYDTRPRHFEHVDLLRALAATAALAIRNAQTYREQERQPALRAARSRPCWTRAAPPLPASSSATCSTPWQGRPRRRWPPTTA